MTQSYRVACEDDDLYVKFQEQKGSDVRVVEISRSKAPLNSDMKAEIAENFEQFRRIYEVKFSCGTSSKQWKAESEETFDFSGKIKVVLSGRHSKNPKTARARCDQLDGLFESATERDFIVSKDEVRSSKRRSIGQCITAVWSSTIELDSTDSDDEGDN